MFLNLIDNAPASLNTLNELATALANDANFATNVQNQIALKASITYVDGQLTLKADQLTTYTKTEVDAALGLEAKQSTTYTKIVVDGLVPPNSDKSYVYTQ